MPQPIEPFAPGHNPLADDRPETWDRLIEAVHPPSLLVLLREWLSDRMALEVSPQDVLQEALLCAWRDRREVAWSGVAAFRRWLLCLARRRIRDLVDTVRARKRGGGVPPRPLHRVRTDTSSSSVFAGPVDHTTPSRIAQDREQAEAMRTALNALPDDLRPVLVLRLFEDLEIAEVAQQLGLGESAVRHRFRKAAAIYQRELHRLLSGTPEPCDA